MGNFGKPESVECSTPVDWVSLAATDDEDRWVLVEMGSSFWLPKMVTGEAVELTLHGVVTSLEYEEGPSVECSDESV